MTLLQNNAIYINKQAVEDFGLELKDGDIIDIK
jgi:hypothetical protein